MVTRNRIKSLEKEFEKIEPKERPVMIFPKELLNRDGVTNSTPYMRIGYYENESEIIFLPDLPKSEA